MNIIELDDNLEYYEVDNIVDNGIKYLLLAEVKNIKNISIRKIETFNGEELVTFLDNKEEFIKLYKLFKEKNKAFFN